MEKIIGGIIIAVIVVVVLLIATSLLRKVIWFFNPVFFGLNYLLWVFYNPIRGLFKKPDSEFGRRIYLSLNTLFIPLIYWVIIHVLSTPLRAVISLYFDVLVYWSVMLDDLITEVFMPKRGSYRNQQGITHHAHWLLALPLRLVVFVFRSFFAIVDSVLMVGISLALPTITMYHGSNFKQAVVKIVQDGTWLVGNGDYAGSGIYFSISRKVAGHYSESGENRGILILRLTPTFTRNPVTLKKPVRELVGNDGKALRLSFPFYTIEHWRNDYGGWWEYCLLQPGKSGKYIRTWRIRPIAVLKDDDHKISRVWGGMRPYCWSVGNCFAGAVSWLIVAGAVALMNN